jgi:hypothetical protein
VLDVSTRGVGLELLGVGAEVGDDLVVDLPLVHSTIAPLILVGDVRHAIRTPAGVRVGVRFADVGELELALLRRLVARQRHERRRPGVVVPLANSRAVD